MAVENTCRMARFDQREMVRAKRLGWLQFRSFGDHSGDLFRLPISVLVAPVNEMSKRVHAHQLNGSFRNLRDNPTFSVLLSSFSRFLVFVSMNSVMVSIA